MWLNYSRAATARDMRIAKLAGFNFARVFLNVAVWEAQPKEFLADVAHFISTAHGDDVLVLLLLLLLLLLLVLMLLLLLLLLLLTPSLQRTA